MFRPTSAPRHRRTWGRTGCRTASRARVPPARHAAACRPAIASRAKCVIPPDASAYRPVAAAASARRGSTVSISSTRAAGRETPRSARAPALPAVTPRPLAPGTVATPWTACASRRAAARTTAPTFNPPGPATSCGQSVSRPAPPTPIARSLCHAVIQRATAASAARTTSTAPIVATASASARSPARAAIHRRRRRRESRSAQRHRFVFRISQSKWVVGGLTPTAMTTSVCNGRRGGVTISNEDNQP